MHREALTQQTKKEGHSGASVISRLFPGVQVERDWWGALQQVCSCRSRLAHKRRLTASERRGETPSGKFSPNNFSLFLVRPSWVRRRSRKQGFGSRSWVKTSSPHCGSANCWRPSAPQLISCRTSITFMSPELRQQDNTRRFSWPLGPCPFLHQQLQHGRYVHLSAWSSGFAEQNEKYICIYIVYFEKEKI